MGHDYPLVSGESLDPTYIEEALRLLVHSSYGLYLTLLIHRSRDGNSLLCGQVRQAEEDGV